MIDDHATEQELLDAAALHSAVIVSHTIHAPALKQKVAQVATGMVILDPVTLADGTNGNGVAANTVIKKKPTLIITDNTHEITAPFALHQLVNPFTIYPRLTSAEIPGLAPDAISLATTDSLPTWSPLFVVESGGELLSGFGSAPARRVGGLLGGKIDNMSEDGKILLRRAIEWVRQPLE